MMYGIITVVCIAGILVILLRKLPTVVKFDFLKIKKEADRVKKVENKKAVVSDKNNSKKKNSFPFFKKDEEQDELFVKADKLFSKKKYKDAEKILIRLVARDPQNVKFYNRLGVIYMEEENYQDAKDAFYEALKLDSKKASRHYNYAMACAEMSEFRNAIESLKHSIKLDKKNKKYQRSLENLEKKVKYRYREMKRVDD